MMLSDLSPRTGTRPRTTSVNPHTQLTQNAPAELQQRVRDHALTLPGVRRGSSGVSVPGSVAFFRDAPPNDPQIPNLFGNEWGHIHPGYDGSLHLDVPTALAERLIALGWAEFHNVVLDGLVPPIVVMVYGPRNGPELTVVNAIVEAAYVAAGGVRHDTHGELLTSFED